MKNLVRHICLFLIILLMPQGLWGASFYVWPDKGGYISNQTGCTDNNYGSCVAGSGATQREELIAGFSETGTISRKLWLRAAAFDDSCANHAQALDSVILWLYVEAATISTASFISYVPTVLDTNTNPNEGGLCGEMCTDGAGTEMSWNNKRCVSSAWGTAGAAGTADTMGVYVTDTVTIAVGAKTFGDSIRFRVDTSRANLWKSAEWKNEGFLVAGSARGTGASQYITFFGPGTTGSSYVAYKPKFQCFYTVASTGGLVNYLHGPKMNAALYHTNKGTSVLHEPKK